MQGKLDPLLWVRFVLPLPCWRCGPFIKEFIGAFGSSGVPSGTWHVTEPGYYPGVICSIYNGDGCGRNARIRKRGMPRDCSSVIEFCQDRKPCPRFLTWKMGIR